MKIEIFNNVSDSLFIEKFNDTVKSLDPVVKDLLASKDFTLRLCNSIYDIKDKEKYNTKLSKNYVEGSPKYPTRGICTDENGDLSVCVFTEHLKIEHLEAVFYHEIGHFLDGYELFSKQKEIECIDKFISISSEFYSAYKTDLTENYHAISNDKRFRLIHYIQDSTPEKINKVAVIETFAEIYRVLNNKENNEKTVELYFPRAIDQERMILLEKYGIRL